MRENKIYNKRMERKGERHVTIDHLVHGQFQWLHGRKPAKQMQELDFHTVLGGEHHELGTWNSLKLFLIYQYIEFLAVQHEEKSEKKQKIISTKETVVKLQNGEGNAYKIAIRTDAIEELAVNFNKYGLHR